MVLVHACHTLMRGCGVGSHNPSGADNQQERPGRSSSGSSASSTVKAASRSRWFATRVAATRLAGPARVLGHPVTNIRTCHRAPPRGVRLRGSVIENRRHDDHHEQRPPLLRRSARSDLVAGRDAVLRRTSIVKNRLRSTRRLRAVRDPSCRSIWRPVEHLTEIGLLDGSLREDRAHEPIGSGLGTWNPQRPHASPLISDDETKIWS